MGCHETEHLITLRIDGAITKNEEAVLREHLEGCKVCARELALREKLSGALREIGREEIDAPPEFCGLVMAKLRGGRRSPFMWLPAAWRKTIAAAAAVLLLAGGSAGVTAGLKLAGGGKIIATNPVQTTEVDTGDNFIPTPVDNSQGGEGAGGTEAGSIGNAGSDEAGRGKDNVNITPENVPNESKTGGSIASSQTVLLSSGMKTTSTLLKVAVSDLGEARAKAVAFAAGAGASTQVWPEQNGDRKIIVMMMTLPEDIAPELITRLAGIGALIDRTDERSDITSLYNETLVQYMDLQSRISSSQNTEEQRQMEVQAASHKAQLDAWNAEVGKWIITLWLESN